MKVTGTTPEARGVARRLRRSERRARMYTARMRSADTAGRVLLAACDYVRAVATDLPAGQVREIAREVTVIADRWNKGETR
jgi:hypothetical protein